MKRYIVGMFLCLMSSSVWSMKRMNGPNGIQGGQPKRTKIAQEDLDNQFLKQIKAGNFQSMQELLVKGANVNAEHGRSKWSALHHASGNGNNDLVRFLLDNGAVVDAKDSEGATPLFRAALKGHKKVCVLLLDRGAAVDAKNSEGWIPLHLAAGVGHKEVCGLLLGRNAAVDAQTSQGGTPLHIAALKGHKEVCEVLLGRNAAVDARLNRDIVFYGTPIGEFTPLHLAVYFNRVEVVKVLIAAHADKYARTLDGRTVIDIARQRGHNELIAYLETTLEEELPAADLLPQLAAAEESALPNLLSAVEELETERVIQLIEAKAYTDDEFFAAYMMAFMTATGPASVEIVGEKVPMS